MFSHVADMFGNVPYQEQVFPEFCIPLENVHPPQEKDAFSRICTSYAKTAVRRVEALSIKKDSLKLIYEFGYSDEGIKNI